MKTNDYLRTLRPIVMAAGKKAASAWKRYDRRESELKGRTEIVTAIDKGTEKYLTEKISRAFPGYGILGEESGSNGAVSDYCWIIDPIDGTTNFSIHNPLWSISIGLSCRGQVIFGLIYAPMLEEMYWAEKGKGAYRNGKMLKIAKRKGDGKEIHAFCHGHSRRDIEMAIRYYGEQKRAALDCRQLGSAAIELAFVAAGRLDSIFIPGARSWDIAAGALIASEAGAALTDIDGKPWTIKSKDIVAVRPVLKDNLMKIIKKVK